MSDLESRVFPGLPTELGAMKIRAEEAEVKLIRLKLTINTILTKAGKIAIHGAEDNPEVLLMMLDTILINERLEYSQLQSELSTATDMLAYHKAEEEHAKGQLSTTPDAAKELVRDKQRLEAVEKNGWQVYFNHVIGYWLVMKRYQTTGHIGKGSTPRQAIDSAMAKQQKGEM